MIIFANVLTVVILTEGWAIQGNVKIVLVETKLKYVWKTSVTDADKFKKG